MQKAHDEQCLLLPQCFQNLFNNCSFKSLHIRIQKFAKSYAADLLQMEIHLEIFLIIQDLCTLSLPNQGLVEIC